MFGLQHGAAAASVTQSLEVARRIGLGTSTSVGIDAGWTEFKRRWETDGR